MSGVWSCWMIIFFISGLHQIIKVILFKVGKKKLVQIRVAWRIFKEQTNSEKNIICSCWIFFKKRSFLSKNLSQFFLKLFVLPSDHLDVIYGWCYPFIFVNRDPAARISLEADLVWMPNLIGAWSMEPRTQLTLYSPTYIEIFNFYRMFSNGGSNASIIVA